MSCFGAGKFPKARFLQEEPYVGYTSPIGALTAVAQLGHGKHLI